MAISTPADWTLQKGTLLSSGGEPKTAVQRVYDDLRERIVSLALPPGTILSRVALAKEYEVSQTPLREAMQRLEHDGLIRIFPQSKTVVTKIDVAQLNETHFLRVAVEAEVVRRLAKQHDPATVKKARALLAMQETLAENLDEMGLFNDLDEAFHQTLFDGVGQLNLHNLLKAKAGHLARARRLDLPKGDKVRRILLGHKAVIDAIEIGDAQAAQDAMRDHLTGTVRQIETLRQEHPDYFRPPA